MTDTAESAEKPKSGARRLLRLLPWLITIACFTYLYGRIDAAAARQDQTLLAYLASVFQSVSWWKWLLLMAPYSVFFFLIDSLIVWRVISWFNTKVPYADILPIRASAYILSILNEQVSKGAMGIYLYRRDKVPGWEVGSSMLFIMFCEFYYLLGWATLGVALQGDKLASALEASQVPNVFAWIPWIAVVAGAFFVLWVLYFRGSILPGVTFRDRPVMHAFRRAGFGHYGMIVLLRSPALLAAVVVYKLALDLFGVEVSLAEMLGFLPIIFFGAATPGPMRSVAIFLWVILFPEDLAGEMTAFGFVQHNFFIFFNATIGLLFLRRANRELFGSD
jgi:hypothetical protein